MKRLMKTIEYYDQKRATFRQELRNPQTQLTAEDKRKAVAVFDARIDKRTQQILELNKSMPSSTGLRALQGHRRRLVLAPSTSATRTSSRTAG